MKTKRLKKLVDLMEQLESNKVEIGYSLTFDRDDHLPTTFDMNDWRCGTAACAIGWAATDEWFNSRGLTLDCGMTGNPQFNDKENWAAVAEFFKISVADATYLFSAYSYKRADDVKPGQVAKRIKKYIRAQQTMKELDTNTSKLPVAMKELIAINTEVNNGNA